MEPSWKSHLQQLCQHGCVAFFVGCVGDWWYGSNLVHLPWEMTRLASATVRSMVLVVLVPSVVLFLEYAALDDMATTWFFLLRSVLHPVSCGNQ